MKAAGCKCRTSVKRDRCRMGLARLIPGFSVAVVLLSASVSFGQGGYNMPRGHSDNPNGPTVSPYLNLLQTNSQGLSNYQSLVKPMIDQQNTLQRQGNSIQRLQQQVGSAGSAPGATRGTGHATRFGNLSHYYSPGVGR